MPQETKSKPSPVATETNLQGLVACRNDEQELLDALEKAFDYRGDVSLNLDTGQRLDGYIFDRHRGEGLADSSLRLMPNDSDDKIAVSYADIVSIEFTGKDTAHGKSFERWIERYIEKKRKGESASIEAESLD